MFSYRNYPAAPAEGGIPSVYVVDSHATRPVLPPRPDHGRRNGRAAQTLLFLLVSLALGGLIVQACFIYRLYQSESANSASFAKIIAAQDPTIPPYHDIPPSKPLAHLTDGHSVIHGKQVMAWSIKADPLLHEMTYRNGSLIIQKQGYYYVYSKVFFTDRGKFHHYVNMHTERYAGGIITLLQARKYSPSNQSDHVRSNSFLGGVFHLYENDAINVNVSNTGKIVRFRPEENVFGVFML